MNDIKRAVQAMYDETGEYFSKTREKSYGESENWPVIQTYLNELEKGMRILDVGCGSGRLLSGLMPEIEYVGIDFSRTLLEIAREKYPEREFRYGDICDTKTFEGLGMFGAVFSIATLHHVPSYDERLTALKMMYSVTKPKGVLYLTVWNLWNTRLLEGKLKGYELVEGEVVEIPFENKSGRHVVALDTESVAKLMKEAGWEPTEIYYANREGERCEIREGENLVAVGRK